MLAAIARIEDYTQSLDHAAFNVDTSTQDAVIRNLEVLGEAARNVLQNDATFISAHPQVPWALAYRMRNALSHGYADVDLNTVWGTIQASLPKMKQQLLELLQTP
jgi:uncharacterized protein with HEPN domain